MPLKLNVGVSRKVGLPDYCSAGASCNVEVELDSGLQREGQSNKSVCECGTCSVLPTADGGSLDSGGCRFRRSTTLVICRPSSSKEGR